MTKTQVPRFLLISEYLMFWLSPVILHLISVGFRRCSAKIRHLNMSVSAVGNCVGHFLLLFFDVLGTKWWIEKIMESCSSKVINNRLGSRVYLMSWGARKKTFVKDLLTSSKAISLTDRLLLTKCDLKESGTWAALPLFPNYLAFIVIIFFLHIWRWSCVPELYDRPKHWSFIHLMQTTPFCSC